MFSREAQCERLSHVSHPHGGGCLGACLLSGLQEREGQVPGGLLEYCELG